MKNEKFLKVSTAVLEIIHERGASHLNISNVAKKASVSRAWIYQYIGSSKENLIETAAQTSAQFFARSHIDIELFDEISFKDKITQATSFILNMSYEHPVYIKAYFQFKGSKTILGDVIENYEKNWIRKFSKHIIKVFHLSNETAQMKAKALLILRLGYCLDCISKDASKNKIEAHIENLVQIQLSLF